MKNKARNAALITGAAKKIGREMALSLASQGFDIAITYNTSKQDAQKLAEEIVKKNSKQNIKCKIFQCDLTNQKAALGLISQVVKEFPNLNLLINNASIFEHSKFLDAAPTEFSDNLNIHFISPLILSQKFANHVLANKIKDAQIINMLDKNIVRYDTNYFYYLLTKKNLADLTKMLALELAPKIRVNGIAPGFILKSNLKDESSDEYIEKVTKRIPLQRIGNVKNICQTVEFLLNNNFINGEIVFVDGGASLNHAG